MKVRLLSIPILLFLAAPLHASVGTDSVAPSLLAVTAPAGPSTVYDRAVNHFPVLRLTVADDLAGVQYMMATFSPVSETGEFSGENEITVHSLAERTLLAGTPQSGTFSMECRIPRGTVAGNYRLRSLQIADASGNIADYADDGSAPAIPMSGSFTFSIAGVDTPVLPTSGDTAPPALDSIAISPASVGVATSAGFFKLSIGAIDDVSGIEAAEAWIESPSGDFLRLSTTGDEAVIVGDEKSGTLHLRGRIPAGAEAGQWRVARVGLRDRTGKTTLMNWEAESQLAEAVLLVNATDENDDGGSGDTIDSDQDGIPDGMDLVDFSAPKPLVHANTTWEWAPPSALSGVTRFQATGLPPGVKFNALTGGLSGIPTRPGTFAIALRALHGTTWGQWQELTLEVRAWPAHSTGGFVALLGRESTLNQSLGGLLQVSTTSLGQLTGSLRLGGQSVTLRSKLAGAPGENPTSSITLPRRGLAPLLLSLTWDPEDGLTGSLSDGTTSSPLAGWKRTWDARANPAPLGLRGQFNAVLPLVSNDADARPVPQGSGWTILRIDAAGIATFTGKTAEGARFTSALPVGPDGAIALWSMPANSPSSLMGQAEIAGNRLDGSLGWVKLPRAGRSWPQGFGTATEPVRLSIKGARYTQPAPGTALTAWGLPATYPNALVATLDGTAFSFAVNPNGFVSVAKAGTTGNPNFAKIFISLRDGLIAGSWVIPGIDPNNPAKKLYRTATFETLILPREDVVAGAFACGFQLVPDLPVAGQKANTSLMVSENACLFPITP